MDADRIIVLDDGRVVGIGTHRELMETSEVYREIVPRSSRSRRSHERESRGRRRPAGRRRAGPARPMFGGGPMGGLGMPVQKAKNFKGTLQPAARLLPAAAVSLLIVVAGGGVIGTVFSVLGPKILGLATTKLFEGFVAQGCAACPGAAIDFAYIGHILLILIGLYVISARLQYVQQYLMAGVAQQTVYALRREVEEKFDAPAAASSSTRARTARS